MSQLLPPKKEVALALLERSNVDIYLDPRAKGVVVPPQFRKEPRLILKIGLNMPVPIPDLRLDEDSMSCTLSFSRVPFFCVVPWPSVFAMVGEDGRGMVWPDDVPQELAVRVGDERRPAAVPPPPESSPAPTPRSKRARDEARAAQGAASERPARGKRTKKKKEERPVLVAVPAPERESGARDGERRPDAPTAPAAPAARPQSPAARPPNRPKRELPPYLRVVK